MTNDHANAVGTHDGAAQPVDEGEVAADFLEGLLDIVDVEGDIEIDTDGDRTTVVIGDAADDLGRLSEPRVVAALQDLTRLAVQRRSGEFARVVLDVGGSRDARAIELAAEVAAAVEALSAGASEAPLAPMSSYERRVVHGLVRDAGLVSASEGDGAGRHIVIRPA